MEKEEICFTGEDCEKVMVRNFVLCVILLIFSVPICNSLSENKGLILLVFQVRA